MRDTMHLSITEHGAYSLLLDAAYATEKPLPASYDDLNRMCRAMSKAEQVAVKSVADQFFPIRDDGLRHNPRADREISVAQSTIQKQRESGVKSAAKRWSTDESTHEYTDRSSIQPPTTNHHTPTASLQPPKETTLSGKPDAINGFKTDAIEILDYLNRNAGKSFRETDTNLKLIAARLKSGVTPLQCREVVHAKCQQWKADPKMAEYLRPATLFNPTKFEQYLGEINV